MYRILIKEEKNLLWYISFCSLIVSLVLSMRQKLYLEDFAPFVVLSVPLMIKVFFNSYRVRLPRFRKIHTILFVLVGFSLLLSTVASYFNQSLYTLVNEPSKHFAIKYHVARELAKELKAKKVYNIRLNDEKMALRLKFYDIQNVGSKYQLSTQKPDIVHERIEILYSGVVVKTFYLYEI